MQSNSLDHVRAAVLEVFGDGPHVHVTERSDCHKYDVFWEPKDAPPVQITIDRLVIVRSGRRGVRAILRREGARAERIAEELAND